MSRTTIEGAELAGDESSSWTDKDLHGNDDDDLADSNVHRTLDH